ncbi:rod shape-determining protein MreC, partial [Salmonella bongori]|uniref:rod shape-determining protein MreC n=1 Tax=Salmonella bongori TaxID=54736 RepID=UPI003306BEC9
MPNNTTPWNDTVETDKGSSDGVKPDMAVTTPSGVGGKVGGGGVCGGVGRGVGEGEWESRVSGKGQGKENAFG